MPFPPSYALATSSNRVVETQGLLAAAPPAPGPALATCSAAVQVPFGAFAAMPVPASIDAASAGVSAR